MDSLQETVTAFPRQGMEMLNVLAYMDHKQAVQQLNHVYQQHKLNKKQNMQPC